MNIKTLHLGRAVIAGVIGAIVMSIVGMWIAPMMGMPRMNPAHLLAKAMGNNLFLGWMGHLIVGVILAIIYCFVQSRIPGPSAIRGALFSLAPWILTIFIVAPMMGMSMFFGSRVMTMESLIGHVVYGLVMGSIYKQSKNINSSPNRSK